MSDPKGRWTSDRVWESEPVAPAPYAGLVERARASCAASGFHEHDGCSCSDAALSTRAVAGEPVAWRMKWRDQPWSVHQSRPLINENAACVIEPLYAHPAPSGRDHIPDVRKMAGRDPATIEAVKQLQELAFDTEQLMANEIADKGMQRALMSVIYRIRYAIKPLAAPAAHLTEDGVTPCR